jgi:hypothetical protein
MKPTTVERLAELTSRMEIMTTDGDRSQLTQDDIGDIYSWLMWAQSKTSDVEELCECGQPKNSIRHSNAAAKSVDAHAFKPAKESKP